MAKTSYYVPNIHVNGEIYRGTWFVGRWFSSKSEDAAAARYEQRVLEVIDKTLWGTWTGCRLLQAIKGRTKKRIDITPYTKADAKELGLNNAYAAPTDAEDAATKGYNPYLGKSDNPKTPKDERFELADYQGTGKGSDSYVHYTADLLDASMGPGMAPDEVLLHELVHSLREMEGHLNQIPTCGKDTAYENQEEFLAILITNLYVSERYGPHIPLRFGHGLGATLPADQRTSDGFLKDADNLLWVRFLASKEPDLFASLATVVQAPFNPIAEFWNNRTSKYK
jgi:hypothetical protein